MLINIEIHVYLKKMPSYRHMFITNSTYKSDKPKYILHINVKVLGLSLIIDVIIKTRSSLLLVISNTPDHRSYLSSLTHQIITLTCHL